MEHESPIHKYQTYGGTGSLSGNNVQGGYTIGDGINADVEINYIIAPTQTTPPFIALTPDIITSGGTVAVHSIRAYATNYFVRETNNATIGGWWLAVGR